MALAHHIGWCATKIIVFALAKAVQTSAYPTGPGVTLPSSVLLSNSATECQRSTKSAKLSVAFAEDEARDKIGSALTRAD